MQQTHTPTKPNPKSFEYQSRSDVKSLTKIEKNLYQVFDNYELEESRLKRNSQFNTLLQEIQMFNHELVKWKENRHQITNIILTYHLYENLFSRLRYISSFCRREHESNNAISKTSDWFFEQKPKLRCLIKENHASMKTLVLDSGEKDKMNRFLQNSVLKRDFEPYQLMSRTIHPDNFPPKLELKEFKRKHFLPYSTDLEEENPLTSKKSTSTSLLSKDRLTKYRGSVGTMLTANTLKESKDNFHKTVTEFEILKIEERKSFDEEQIKKNIEENEWNEQIEEIEKENVVSKQELLSANLIQNQNEEEDLHEESNIYDQSQSKNDKKLFAFDYDKQEIEYAKEVSKEAQQSSLRRILKINEDKIKSKLQDLDVKRNMLNWGKIKGKTNREESRKLETMAHGNKFTSLTFRRETHKQEQNLKTNKNNENFGSSMTSEEKNPIALPNLLREKSHSQGCLEVDMEKIKIREMYKTFGKYLNHLPVAQNVENEDGENIKKTEESPKETEEIRSMSLTSFASIGKKKRFSEIIEGQSPSKYNDEVHDEIIHIKTFLAKKGTSLERGKIFKALSSSHPNPHPQETQTSINFLTGKNLLSNPFFPKDKSKNKKKKC